MGASFYGLLVKKLAGMARSYQDWVLEPVACGRSAWGGGDRAIIRPLSRAAQDPQ